MGSLALRPGDSLTILKMALSVGFRSLVSFLPATQATGLLTLALAGLTPAECASLRLDALIREKCLPCLLIAWGWSFHHVLSDRTG